MKFEELERIAKSVDSTLYGEIRTEDLFTYLLEEVEELREASKFLDAHEDSAWMKLNQIEEFGDVLFCLVAFARQKDIDITHALSLTIVKLQDRIKNKK